MYDTYVLADDPVVYYRLDGTVGRTVDSSGNGHTLTAHGSNFVDRSSLLREPANGSCEFDTETAEGYLELADSSPLMFIGTDPFTVELWVDPVNVESTWRKLLSWSNSSDAGTSSFSIYYHSPEGYALNRRVDGSLYGGYCAFGTFDAIHHVVGVYNGSTLITYVDGSAHHSSELTGGGSISSYGSQTFRVGMGQYGGDSATAIIDEVAIYDYALSTARIDAHYQAGRALFAQAAQAYTLNRVTQGQVQGGPQTRYGQIVLPATLAATTQGIVTAVQQMILPDADLAYGNWTTAPLYSKLNDSSDATYAAATSA